MGRYPFITDFNMHIDDVSESRTRVLVELAESGNGGADIKGTGGFLHKFVQYPPFFI